MYSEVFQNRTDERGVAQIELPVACSKGGSVLTGEG